MTVEIVFIILLVTVACFCVSFTVGFLIEYLRSKWNG